MLHMRRTSNRAWNERLGFVTHIPNFAYSSIVFFSPGLYPSVLDATKSSSAWLAIVILITVPDEMDGNWRRKICRRRQHEWGSSAPRFRATVHCHSGSSESAWHSSRDSANPITGIMTLPSTG